MAPPRPPRAATATSGVALESELARLRDRLRADGVVKLSGKKLGALYGALAPRLRAEGFEVTPSLARRPLDAQLRDALRGGDRIAVSALPRLVRGASRAELGKVLDAAVARGEARRVLHGRTQLLVGPEHEVVAGPRLTALAEALSALAQLLASARKKKHVGLLASDVAQGLSVAQRLLESEAPAATPGGAEPIAPAAPLDATTAATLLFAAVDAARDPHSGLSFVPSVVERLRPQMTLGAAHELLMAAARRELLELRPEGGLGRLSPDEVTACPRGPGASVLSWARRAPGVEA